MVNSKAHVDLILTTQSLGKLPKTPESILRARDHLLRLAACSTRHATSDQVRELSSHLLKLSADARSPSSSGLLVSGDFVRPVIQDECVLTIGGMRDLFG